MPDFPIIRHTDRLILSTASPHSIGAALQAMGFAGVVGTWPTANLAFYIPISVHSTLTVVKMFIENGGTASGNVDLGIYDAGGTRLVSTGSTAQSGTSAIQEFDITDTTLTPGLYYLAMAIDNTTATLQRWSVTTALAKAIGVCTQASAFALPSSATFATPSSGNLPFIGATIRSVV